MSSTAKEWRSSDPNGSDGQTLTVPTVLPQPSSYAPPPDSETQPYTFTVLTDFDSAHALPMAQTPEQISAGDLGDLTWDPSRGQAFVDGGLDAGLEYTVRSRVVVPTAEQLEQVQQPDVPAVRAVDPPPRRGRPRSTDRGARDMRGRTAPSRTTTRCSRSSSTSTATGSSTARTSTWPTTPTPCSRSSRRPRPGSASSTPRRWPCWSASSGCPHGSRSGTRPARSRTTARTWCRSKNAHAWVEVFFEGYGWLQFEPTPGTRHPPERRRRAPT